ncbi:cell wall hydrolase [Saccharibacillus sp. O23]|uniref:cell wall hydrolase n=1 Tax=Saccharibacillus sp. O23 TaxID=2009338 RepID=UPI000B4E1F41|nr:cell wall hydrolase [Saccharibacillus sp. O23]OWR33016.1 cell wall hydrolase [Saccharibacillus sp. O23]
MEQLKNNRWVALLVGVILIFICAGTVWASNGGVSSHAEAAGASLGTCELTEVVFDDALHPENILRTAAWTQQEEQKSDSSADKQSGKNTAGEEKATVSSKSAPSVVSSSAASSKAPDSGVSDTKSVARKQAAPTSGSAQKNKAAAAADQKAAVKKAATSHTPPNRLFFTKTAMLSQAQASKATWTYTLSDQDLILLQRIVMAEAEGEPYAGKVAVANVVLNRLRSANYPDTIRDVIYQRYQFSPVQNGRFDRVKPSADSIKAVAEALNGRKEVTDDTYYFVSLELATDMTIPNTRTPVKKIGHHTFFK